VFGVFDSLFHGLSFGLDYFFAEFVSHGSVELYVVGCWVVNSLFVEAMLLLDEAFVLWREPSWIIFWDFFVFGDGLLECFLEKV
jgi:hypothetical protein